VIEEARDVRLQPIPPAPMPPSQPARRSADWREVPSHRRRRDLLLDLPIAWRLTLGFVLAAAIAAAATGASYLQRAQSLANEASFYEGLLASNTALTSGATFLQLMDTKVHSTLTDAAAPKPSRETLADDQTAVSGLVTRFDAILADYTSARPLDIHPDEVALLTQAGHGSQVTQQRTLVSSVVRAWQVYRAAQSQVLADIASGNVNAAAALERAQAEPTYTDALSAVRALIQFNGRIAGSVHDAAVAEQQNQLLTVIIASFLAVLGIAAVGWVISDSLVRRLRGLRSVLVSVDEGRTEERVAVVGRDEIGRVSGSVNRMLDTIVGLLDVTRRQRDALTSAAERLFADVRVAGAGDLRASGTVGGDPIGMLANAFNFTVSRFRQFVVRTQTTVDQLDVIARQQHDRSQLFLGSLQQMARGSSPSSPLAAHAADADMSHVSQARWRDADLGSGLHRELGHAHDLVRLVAAEGTSSHARAALDLAEQAYLSAGRLSQIALSAMAQRPSGYTEQVVRAQMNELRTLGKLLVQLGEEARAVQGAGAERLAELDATLDRLASSGHGGASGSYAALSSSPLGDGQGAEMTRLAIVFANDVSTLARHVATVTQEMRAGLSKFRLEGGAQQAPTLYAPGARFAVADGYLSPTREDRWGANNRGELGQEYPPTDYPW
jgi:methyl-accepting chemotaxis protein